MDVEYHISQLLYRYQRVTIPGFGAFLTEVQSAQLFENINAFYPPKKVICFDPYLKDNDGLLANQISCTENISYEGALVLIGKEVVHWKKILHRGEILIIKDVGTILLNSESNLVFEVTQRINYLTDSFGFTSFVSLPVKRQESDEQEVEFLEEKIPVVLKSEAKNHNSYLKYVAIFAIALGITSISLKLYDNYVKDQILIVEKEVQKEVEHKIQEATFFISNPISSVVFSIKKEKKPYHVVAGVFREESNAEKEYKNLIQLGYKATKIGKNRYGLFSVFYDSFESHTEALQLLNEVQKTFNPEAWLLIGEL